MGWLRDLMQAAQPAISSFDQLADRCLSHADWPTEISIQKRSLGALLGKLDRELELDWLTHRPSVQATLARVLGTSREELILASTPASRHVDGRHVRLDDLPTGRPLDLISEPLFPGIPERVFQPATWQGLWWLTPSGSGRSLVGSWLRARGLLSLAAPAGRAGPVAEYLEIDDVASAPVARPGLCVAAPFPPRPDAGFEVVRSAPLSEALAELVDFAADRLPEQGRFERSELQRFIIEGPLAEGWLESAGAVIGLCGLADELGMAELRRRSTSKLVRHYLRHRASLLLDPESTSTDFVKRSAADSIVSLLRRSIVDSDEPWWSPRTLETWTSLLPRDLGREADLEWLKLALGRSESGIRAKDLERAARALPPGAFRVVRALERIGVLRRVNDSGLALRPHWLVEALVAETTSELARAAPTDWGEALLRPHAAPRVATAVFSRVLSGDAGAIDDVTDLDGADEPALAAATECALRCAGVALLRGVELSADALESLWDQSLELLHDPPERAPVPRIVHSTPRDEATTLRLGHALLSTGSYYLGALAISEQLADGVGRAHASLRPWADESAEVPALMLDAMLEVLERFPELAIAAPAARLAGRLSITGHALAAPSRVLAGVASGSLEWATWLEATRSTFGVRALEETLAGDPEARARLARAVWAAWAEAGSPVSNPEVWSRGPLVAALWQAAPESALERFALSAPELVAYEELSAEAWQALIAFFRERGETPSVRELWRAVPESELAGLLGAGLEPSDATALGELWRRAPSYMREALEARFAPDDGRTARRSPLALLASVPARLTGEVAQKCASDERLGRLPSSDLRALELWLHERVTERAPGWRTAYARLAELGRRLSPVRL